MKIKKGLVISKSLHTWICGRKLGLKFKVYTHKSTKKKKKKEKYNVQFKLGLLVLLLFKPLTLLNEAFDVPSITIIIPRG